MKISKITFLIALIFSAIENFSQSVDEFTGSLNYGLPLVTVPSNRGNGIPISASYNAGIAVKQAASEIGLGWSLNAGGAITRNVSGLADDCKSCSVWDNVAKVFRTENGALYTPGDGDLYRTSRNMDSLEFIFPDYDDYFVTGPGISGKMTPFIFDYEMYTKDIATNNRYAIDASYLGKDHPVQFHFNGDFGDTLISRHYSVTPVTAGTTFKLPGDNVAGLNGTTDEPYLGKHLNGATITGENFDPSTNRLASANYIEYFTNAAIDNIGTTNIPGFIDFQVSHSRNSTNFPVDEIGGFRITTPSGFVYHYSLPVYITRVETHTYPLENDYTVPSYATTLGSYSIASSYTWSANENVVTRKTNNNRYAYQWLLTAITGPDYSDVNSNHIVDASDTGYWINFDYKPWCTDFASRTPHYGFDYSFGLDEATKRLPITRLMSGTKYKLSGKTGNVDITNKEIYYLNKIGTTSHTAVFVKDVRRDEVSSHVTTNYTATLSATPQLRTTRIILFKNDSLSSVLSSAATSAIPTTGTNTIFSFGATTNSTAHFFTEDWYTNLNSINKGRILKNVEFTQDYSLCRNYHGNISVSSLTCSVITPPDTVQSKIATTTYSLSGKLTLTKILFKELQNVQVVPSYTFDYNQSSSTDNPDYNPKKTDYWGFYKSDVTSSGYSGYTNSTSKDYTDAWSLRKIMQPMGGYTEFEYESNSYNKVLDNKNGYRGAAFIYPIKTLTLNSTPNYIDVTMEENTNPSEFSSLMSGAVGGVTKTICTPMSPLDLSNYPGSEFYVQYILFGDFTHSGSSSPYVVSSIDKYVEQYQSDINCFSYLTSGGVAPGDQMGPDYEYSGNGYIMFETPIGYEVYGNGPRVKKVKTYNHANEIYVQEYTYEDGVATGEADRFEYPTLKASCGQSTYFVNKLNPISFDKHSMGARIGYSKVITKNLGRSNTANGSLVNEFITSYTVNGTPIVPNHSVTISNNSTNAYQTSYCPGTCPPSQTIPIDNLERKFYLECFDKYSPYWGLKKEERIHDVNDNIISKITYEYESTEQGALVENFIFNDIESASLPLIQTYYVNILRRYPVVLKKTKSYGMGSYTESETLKRDEITGESILLRSAGQNGSTSLSSKIHAFRISAFSAMGPKSVNSSNKNILSPEAYSFMAVDTTLTPVSSGIGSSFLSAGATVFKNTTNVRAYNSSVFSIQSRTLPYWKPGASYGWSGVQGSIDEYGLYKRSQLTANPFNFSSPGSNSDHWRFGSETTLCDTLGHALEIREFNNRFNSVRFGYNNEFVIATGSNSNYASCTYSGFESIMPGTSNSFADGELSLPASNHTLVPTATIAPHTGYQCLALASGAASHYKGIFSNNGTYETGIERGRIYRAIVWVSASSPNDAYLNVAVTGDDYSQNYTMYANDVNAITVGSWKRLYVDFKVPEGITHLSSSDVDVSLGAGSDVTYYDDFMFYPVEGSIKANVYNPGTGILIAELNNMGYATFYTYDEAGRVLDTRQEIPGTGIKLVKRNSYNFARTN